MNEYPLQLGHLQEQQTDFSVYSYLGRSVGESGMEYILFLSSFYHSGPLNHLTFDFLITVFLYHS